MSVVKINAIEVPDGMGAELEKRFAARAGEVDGAPGFEEFMLLRPIDGETRYFVLTRWADEASFQAWRTSREFQQQHAGPRTDDGEGGARPPQPVATGASAPRIRGRDALTTVGSCCPRGPHRPEVRRHVRRRPRPHASRRRARRVHPASRQRRGRRGVARWARPPTT